MTLRKGPTYPIRVGSSFLPRVQSFEVNKRRQIETEHEMGNFGPTGVSDGNIEYTGSIEWNPIDNDIEERFGGKTPGAGVNLKQIMEAAAILVQSTTDGINAAKLTSLEYSCQIGQSARGVAQVRGTGWNDGDGALAATTPTGNPSYRSKSIAVVVGGSRAVRCAGFTVRVNIPTEDSYEMGNEDPFDTDQSSPTVTAEIDWYEDTLATGMVEPSMESPVDVIIGIGGTAKLITLKNCVWQDTGVRGRVRGAGTRRYSYMSKGDETTYGLGLSTNIAPTCALSVSDASVAVGEATNLIATAYDANGVFKVHFYRGTTKIGEGTATGLTGYTCLWTGTAVGTYYFTAKAEDTYGAKTSSTGTVAVTVTGS